MFPRWQRRTLSEARYAASLFKIDHSLGPPVNSKGLKRGRQLFLLVGIVGLGLWLLLLLNDRPAPLGRLMDESCLVVLRYLIGQIQPGLRDLKTSSRECQKEKIRPPTEAASCSDYFVVIDRRVSLC
jgi:hypothetical protein